MNLHGSEVLVSRAFEASPSKIIWRYADLFLHTSLQCKTVDIAVLEHYLLNYLVVQGCKAWLRQILVCKHPRYDCVFDTLTKVKFKQQSLLFLKDVHWCPKIRDQ